MRHLARCDASLWRLLSMENPQLSFSESRITDLTIWSSFELYRVCIAVLGTFSFQGCGVPNSATSVCSTLHFLLCAGWGLMAVRCGTPPSAAVVEWK